MSQPSKKYGGDSTRKSRRRLKVVVDTGVLVSAFAFDGLPEKAVRYAMQTATVYVSPLLLAEYREVPGELLAEEKISRLQWETLIVGIASFVRGARVINAREAMTVCRDPKDNMVLECCLAARADVLVTGDKDLLDIDPQELRSVGLGKLRIRRPGAYLRENS